MFSRKRVGLMFLCHQEKQFREKQWLLRQSRLEWNDLALLSTMKSQESESSLEDKISAADEEIGENSEVEKII